MAGKSAALYLGVTNYLERRVAEHKLKIRVGFTEKYGIDRLVCFETFSDVRYAIAREKQLKGWSRIKKVRLIEKANPTWRDLSEDFPKQSHYRTKLVISTGIPAGLAGMERRNPPWVAAPQRLQAFDFCNSSVRAGMISKMSATMP
jgi:putative endonuclease